MIAWLLSALAVPALAAEAPDPASVVRTVVEEVLNAIAAEPQDLRDAIERHVGPSIDPLNTARFALGPHWRDATADERNRVAASILAMVISGLEAALDENRDARVEIVATRKAAASREATVRTRVHRASGPPVSIDYRLLSSDGRWKLFDIGIEGVSMLYTYRRSFSARVRRVGLPAFVDELEARTRRTK